MPKIDLNAMLEGMRDQLERDEASGNLAGITVADLADAMSHPKAAEMVAEITAAETGSVQVGETAPDFSLPWLPPSGDGTERLTLSRHHDERPVALIFGSYT